SSDSTPRTSLAERLIPLIESLYCTSWVVTSTTTTGATSTTRTGRSASSEPASSSDTASPRSTTSLGVLVGWSSANVWRNVKWRSVGSAGSRDVVVVVAKLSSPQSTWTKWVSRVPGSRNEPV